MPNVDVAKELNLRPRRDCDVDVSSQQSRYVFFNDLCRFRQLICARSSVFLTLFLSALLIFVAPDSKAGSTCDPQTDTGPKVRSDPCGVLDDVVDPGSTTKSMAPSTSVGNPISLITGNKYQLENDYVVDNSALQFRRHYNSTNTDYNYGLGRGWSSSYNVTLRKLDDTGLTIVQSNGRRIKFLNSDSTGSEIFYRARSVADGFVQERGNYRFWYLSDGRVLKFKGPFLTRIDYSDHRYLSLYYRDMRLSEVSDETGRVLSFKYQRGNLGLSRFENEEDIAPPGHLVEVINPTGNSIHYQYDQFNNLVSARFSDGTTRDYDYRDADFPNHLTGITDRKGHRYVMWRYDASGLAVESSKSKGKEAVTLQYHLPARQGDVGKTIVTNSIGGASTYTWKKNAEIGQFLLLSSVGPGCHSCPQTGWDYSYDGRDLLSVAQDDHGNSNRYQYDNLGRLVSVFQTPSSGPEVRVRHYEYDGGSYLPGAVELPSVNPNGVHRVSVMKNNENQIVQLSESGYSPNVDGGYDPIERTHRYKYRDKKLVEMDGPRTDVNDVSYYSYDMLNRLSSISRPGQPVIVLDDYNSHGMPRQIKTGSKSPVSLSYTDRGQVRSMSYLSRKSGFSYDPEGLLTAAKNYRGAITRYSYDEVGQLKTLEDGRNTKLQLSRNKENQLEQLLVAASTGEMLRRFDYQYDINGRPTTTDYSYNNESRGELVRLGWRQKYDEVGRLTGLGKEAQSSFQFNYDVLGKLTEIKKPDQSTSSYQYDVKGQGAGVVDEKGNINIHRKDDFNRIVYEKNNDTGVTTYGYDAASNLVEKVKGDKKFSYTWDEAGRLVRESSADWLITAKYSDEHGLLEWIDNQHSLELFEYTAEGFLSEHTRKLDGHEFSTTYGYDSWGRLVEKQLPGEQRLLYQYGAKSDTRWDLQSISRSSALGVPLGELITDIDSDSKDGKTGFRSFNRVLNEKRWFKDGSLKTIAVGNILRQEYQYNRFGNIADIRENGRPQHFRYSSDRLVSAKVLSGNYEFEYDAVGNRTSKRSHKIGEPVVTQNYLYPEYGLGNQLLATSDPDSGESRNIEHNSAGSLILDSDGLQFTYDVNERLVAVQVEGEAVVNYDYNAYGERIKKIQFVNGEEITTYYYYDKHILAGEYEATSGGYSNYLYLGQTPVIALKGRDTYAIHTDHLGAPRLLTDGRGKRVWQASYSPFGRAHITREAVEFNLRFPGQYYDRETAKHYNYLRTYDPETGRYLTSDPVGLRAGSSAYAYVAGNPVHYTDPLGLYLVAFDGTANDKSDDTNVNMFYNYYGETGKDYQIGVATGGWFDYYLLGGPFGFGGRKRINNAIRALDQHLKTSDDTMIDIVGFSRGAAQAREFANRIVKLQQAGMFAKPFTIRFMGLFETVATGFSRANGNSEGKKACNSYDLTIPDEVQQVSQAVAMNEHRIMFPISTIEPDSSNPGSVSSRVQASFIGAHSDIGGGYKPASKEYTSGDLSDVAFVWMVDQAIKAGVPMKPIREEDRRVDNAIVHDERNSLALYGDTDRVVYHPDDETWREAHSSYQEVVQKPEMQRDHPDHQLLKQFILADGTVDMRAYSIWLKREYGIDVDYKQ